MLVRITNKVFKETWAILPEIHASIRSVLIAKLNGQPLPAAETADDPRDVEAESFDDLGASIVPLHGVIGKHISSIEAMCGGCSVDSFMAQMVEARDSAESDRIIIDVRSGGGTVTGVPEAAQLVREIDSVKPVYTFTDSTMASGAYWIGSQAREIFTTRSASIGSVGVYAFLLDETKALEMEGLKVNAVSAGKFKLMGAPFKPLTDEERALFQAKVDKTYAAFKSAILNVRLIEDDLLQGQMFDGEESVQNMFADRLVFDLEEAIEATVPQHESGQLV